MNLIQKQVPGQTSGGQPGDTLYCSDDSNVVNLFRVCMKRDREEVSQEHIAKEV